jgi:hypothetical protein
VRIHWSVVIIAVIGTILITWHLRTREMDFLTPKGVELSPREDDEVGLVVSEPAVQPVIKEQSGLLAQPLSPEGPPVEPELPTIREEDLGDLEAGPGLGEYRDFARRHDPKHLFELSSTLRSRGHFQRALLALERVIDSSEASPEALQEAGQGIAALLPTLPRWNVDPQAEIPLHLHLSLARPASEALKSAVSDLTGLVRESSGDQLLVTPLIESAQDEGASPENPVALWLSSTDDDPASTAVATLRLPAEPEFLLPELSLALFQAIRSHLVPLGFPNTKDLDLSGPQLLRTQTTRLMWRDLAGTLVRSDLPSEEETENILSESD